ncbi:hypothetical protein E5Q_00494 [Mixia osmundae IAM 14324]|uniref:Uncharacterized protein n=1 Tax=Mixia osmundae (strain CBS 9802 / IAM 14324 / JCM 22182 / KY 12970) TaxID=764103 RepID=G7DTK1_MIXOS|nr:hypothetical protein E5Q_00494 [Mixia osmundae IAM 14324]
MGKTKTNRAARKEQPLPREIELESGESKELSAAQQSSYAVASTPQVKRKKASSSSRSKNKTLAKKDKGIELAEKLNNRVQKREIKSEKKKRAKQIY